MSQGDQVSARELAANRMRILSIAESFFQSSILFALLKLRIFERIGEECRTLDDLASELNARPDTLSRLLNAGVALKLLESKDGKNYRVTPSAGMILLPSSGDNYLGNFIRNMDYFRAAVSKLDEAILNAAPTIDPSSILGLSKDHTREFVFAMHNNASYRGNELAKFLDTSSSETIVDLGCGPGTYSFHLGRKNPKLRIYLADLPDILEVAKEIQKKFPIENEVHYLPLDAVKDDLPGTYDIILISNTLHMLGEKESRRLLKRLYNSINAGGSLVVQAQYLRDDHMGEMWPICMDIIQLCVTPEGRNHSVGETREWLEEAGFDEIQYNPMTILNTNSFLRAYKA
jgi:SAM-dependent methyltransferase